MKRNDKGSIAIESLLLVPVLMMFALMVVYVGRWTSSAHRVERAAEVAARAASQSSLVHLQKNARNAAADELSRAHGGCSSASVFARQYMQGEIRYVRVRVSCVVDTVDLGLLRLPPKRVTATSTEVFDFYTQR